MSHTAFRLLLRLHTPIVLPVVTPRLDFLLQEACSRRDQRWGVAHDLPLRFDEQVQGYCGSQLVFGTTVDYPLSGHALGLATSVTRQDLHLTSHTPRRIKLDGGPNANRMTKHAGYLSPYAIFYGEGDPEACAGLFSLLSGIGREHARHAGAFTIEGIEADPQRRWRQRSWPIEQRGSLSTEATTDWNEDRMPLTPYAVATPVVRPPRLLREVLDVR